MRRVKRDSYYVHISHMHSVMMSQAWQSCIYIIYTQFHDESSVTRMCIHQGESNVTDVLSFMTMRDKCVYN